MVKQLLVLSTLFSSFFTFGQNKNDTANNPYWVEMMQDRSVNFYKTQRAFNIYWANRPIEKGSGWKAFKRWEWMAEKTIDSLGNFPDHLAQLNQLNMMIEQDAKRFRMQTLGLGPGSVACNTRGDWKEFGPIKLPTNNTGQMNGMGRLNAVAVHPTDSNTIFAGACAGGIWKTTDGGKNWSVYSDSLPTLGVSSIAFDPNSPNTMYMGTGDRDAGDAAGFGVFKSTNGGNSWVQSNTGMGNRTVGKLIVSPTNSNIVIAATNNGIYRSINAGANWSQVLAGDFKDIIFKPNNHNYIYATRNGILFRSIDNGVNWSSITNGLPTSGMSRGVIDVNTNMPELVYFWLANGSVNRGFYLSRDSGTTFSTQSTTPNLHDYSTNGSGGGGQAWYDKDMVTDPGNPAIVYAGGVNIFRSNDTGKTWTIAGYWVNKIHADQHELISCPLTKRIFAANDGGLYYTRDLGVNWIPIKSGLAIAQIYKMDCSRTQKDILINGYQDNGTGNFNNGWFTTRGGDGMDCEIDQTDNRYSYGELYYGSIFRVFNVNTQATIADNGVNGINESGGWVTPFILKEGSGNTMYIGYKNIWRSNNIRNNPPTWTRISNNLGGTNGSNFTEVESNIANPDIFYASRSNGTFYRSDDVNAATPNWNAVTQPIGGTINAIETDPKIQNAVYIGIGNRVYRSLNKGGSWTQIASNLSHNVNCILLDTSSSKKAIYVGLNGGGVWYTDTTINVWRFYGKGLPHSLRVTDLELYYDNNPKCKNHVLYASTYNRGNWFGPVMFEGTDKPLAKVESYDSVVCLKSIVSFKTDACKSPARFKWEFSPNSVYFTNNTDSSYENATIGFNSKGKYNFKFMAENCNGIDTIEGRIEVGDTIKSVNCKPNTINNVGGLGIFNVQFNGINNLSGSRSQEGGYVDLACNKIFKVKRGKKYALKVTTGTGNIEQVKAFIDFNNDGDLSDAGELVYQPVAALANHSDSILIPLNATINQIIRLRIRSDFTSTGTDPCTNLNYGQTEDYGIIVEDSIKPVFVVNKTKACINESLTFKDSTINEAWQYDWDFGTDASPQTATGKGPHLVKYSSSGYKKVKLSIDGFFKEIDSFVLIETAPDLNIQFTKGDSSICEFESFSLLVNDNNNVSNLKQWYKNNSLITDSTFFTLSESSVSKSDSAVYTFISKNNICSDTVSQHVAIHNKPLVNFNIVDDEQCLTNNLFNFANLSSTPYGTINNTWHFGDLTSSLVQNNPSKTYTNFGNYSVKLVSVSNFNCSDSMTKSVNVFEMPIADFTIDNDSQCFKNHTFNFNSLSSISAGNISHQWMFSDNSTENISNFNKSFSNANSYSVKLVVNSDQNCKDSLTKTFEIFENTKVDFSIDQTSQCFKNNLFNFTNNSTLSNGTFDSDWNYGDNTYSVLNQAPPKNYTTFSDSLKVSLVTITNHFCSDTLSQSIYLLSHPLSSFTINKDSQCLNSNRFVFNNTSTIQNNTMSHQWKFGDGNQSNIQNPTHQYLSNGIFNVKLVSTAHSICKDSIEKAITVFASPLAQFDILDDEQCLKNNNFQFTDQSIISSGNYSNDWSVGDGNTYSLSNVNHSYTTTGNFNVQLINTSNNNCKDTIVKSVKVFLTPTALFDINDSVQCFDNHSFTMTDNSNAGPSYTKQWTVLPNLNIGTSNTVNHNVANAGKFIVKLTVTTNNACKDSINRTIETTENPVFTINGKNKYCLNDTIRLNALSTDLNLKYSWKLSNSPSKTGTSYETLASPIGSKNLTVEAEDVNACKTSETLLSRVNIFGLPVPQIDTNVTINGLGIDVRFLDITPIVVTNRKWSTSPINGVNNGNDFILNLNDSAKINVILSLTDTNNCSGTSSKTYYFIIPNQFFFPNTFSPNGDGFNDQFGIVGFNKVAKFSMQIYNRWGEKVFETNDPSIGWDGKYNGDYVQQGEYVYYISILDLSKKNHYKKGSITILR